MYFCKVCEETFNTVDAKAMVLKCGHTFCHKCIQTEIQSHGEFCCPNCYYKVKDLSETTPNLIFYDRNCYLAPNTPMKTKSKFDYHS